MPANPTQSATQAADYLKSLDCIHCGLCLSSCPTYNLTGRESASPRGRVFLMRSLFEKRIEPTEAAVDELDLCLVCRACESACPAGVRFGEMMEGVRSELQDKRPWFSRCLHWIGFRFLLPDRIALRVAFHLGRFSQLIGTTRLLGWAVKQIKGVDFRAPNIPAWHQRKLLPNFLPSSSKERNAAHAQPNEAVLFEGCVMPELFGNVNHATAQTLNDLGVDCHCPGNRNTCCGALHAHNGDLQGARRMAKATLKAYGKSPQRDSLAPIVVNSAGCGAHMKEYGRLLADDSRWRERAEAFAQRVVDYSEFVAPLLASSQEPRQHAGSLRQPVTWDDPCHLCHGQGIRQQPRDVLASISDLELVPLERSESCCGSAGIYSLLRPADSQAVLAEKLEALKRSGARTLVTANPGCQMQWQSGVAQAGLDVDVLHLAEVLAATKTR